MQWLHDRPGVTYDSKNSNNNNNNNNRSFYLRLTNGVCSKKVKSYKLRTLNQLHYEP